MKLSYSIFQYVTIYFIVFQCISVFCSAFQYVTVYFGMLHYIVVCDSILHYGTVYVRMWTLPFLYQNRSNFNSLHFLVDYPVLLEFSMLLTNKIVHLGQGQLIGSRFRFAFSLTSFSSFP